MREECKECEKSVRETICLLEQLEWEDITEWANQYVLKVERLKKTMSQKELNTNLI